MDTIESQSIATPASIDGSREGSLSSSVIIYKLLVGLFFSFIYFSSLYLDQKIGRAFLLEDLYEGHGVLYIIYQGYSATLFYFSCIFLLVGPFIISLFLVSNNLKKRILLFFIATFVSYGLFLYRHSQELTGSSGYALFFVPPISIFWCIVLVIISRLRRGTHYKELLYKNENTLKKRSIILGILLMFNISFLMVSITRDYLAEKSSSDMWRKISNLYLNGQCDSVPAGRYGHDSVYKSPDDCFDNYALIKGDAFFCAKITEENQRQLCFLRIGSINYSHVLNKIYDNGDCKDISKIENVDDYIQYMNSNNSNYSRSVSNEIDMCYGIKANRILHYCEFKQNIPAGGTLKSCYISRCETLEDGPIRDRCYLEVQEKELK